LITLLLSDPTHFGHVSCTFRSREQRSFSANYSESMYSIHDAAFGSPPSMVVVRDWQGGMVPLDFEI